MSVHRFMQVGLFLCLASTLLAQPRWVATYDGEGQETMRAAVVDADGNVHAGAWASGRIAYVKYAPDGTPVWEKTLDAAAVMDSHVGDDGRVTLVAAVVSDVLWIRFDEGGNEVSRGLEGAMNPRDSVIDADGAVYVGGGSLGEGNYATTLKFAPDGQLLWRREFDAGGIDKQFVKALAVDDDRSVYAAAGSQDDLGNFDIYLLKYDAGGELLWSRNLDGPDGRDDGVWDMVLAADGSPIVVGYFEQPSSASDIVAARFDASGNRQWVTTFDHPEGYSEIPLAAAIDVDDRLVVAGVVYSDRNRTIGRALTMAFDAAGEVMWFDTFHSPQAEWDDLRFLQLDATGNAYVSGTTYMPDNNDDITTIKYSSQGERLWVTRFNGQENVTDTCRGAALSPDGNTLIVHGRTDYESGSDIRRGDALTLAYPTVGNGCKESERLVTRCKVRPRGHKIRAKAMFGTRDEEIQICLDGGACQSGVGIGKSAKVKVKWRRLEAGPHEVTAEWACGALRAGRTVCGE